MKEEKELKQIAMDIFDGKIFCDRHLQSMEDLSMVFMLIPLGAFKDAPEDELKNIGMIYEYMSEAGPMSVNGYPCFMSLKYISKEETEKVLKYFDEYKNLKESFAGKE